MFNLLNKKVAIFTEGTHDLKIVGYKYEELTDEYGPRAILTLKCVDIDDIAVSIRFIETDKVNFITQFGNKLGRALGYRDTLEQLLKDAIQLEQWFQFELSIKNVNGREYHNWYFLG